MAVERIVAELNGCPWTFHRAIDRAADRDVLRKHLADLPGLDTYLTAGSPDGVDAGMEILLAEAAPSDLPGYEPRIMVGGGLRLDHLPRLRAAGVEAFHIGGAARPRGWTARWTLRPYGSGARCSTADGPGGRRGAASGGRQRGNGGGVRRLTRAGHGVRRLVEGGHGGRVPLHPFPHSGVPRRWDRFEC